MEVLEKTLSSCFIDGLKSFYILHKDIEYIKGVTDSLFVILKQHK